MPSHTSGPWHNTGSIIYNAGGWAICNATVFHGRHGDAEMRANAALIAAAPDLLEALMVLRAMAMEYDENNELMSPSSILAIASPAIAKAEGKV